MPLPASLQALSAHAPRQFVGVKLTPDAEKPGKFKKLPINPHTLTAASSTDPATWGTYDEVAATGLPVGFVLTAQDPFFCLDIDDALQQDNTWSPLAQELMAAFPGAAVEVSTGGRGLHIWGVADAPPHKCKNVGLGIELYHKERFIALGRPDATGEVWANYTAHLGHVVARYFPYVAPNQVDGEAEGWTDGPCEGWAGSVDDEDVLRRAHNQKTADKVFGGGTFSDLWEADEARLGPRYPAEGGKGFDRSSADRALAQYLAFWTGRDCARIERLMNRSGLKRDKWEEMRGDQTWLQVTILSAVKDCRSVCVDSKPSAPALVAQGAAEIDMGVAEYVAAEGIIREAPAWVQPEQMKATFQGCIYLERMDRAFVPGKTEPLKSAAFKVRFGGNKFVVDQESGKTISDAWEAWTQSPLYRPDTAQGTCFRPDLPHGVLVNHQGEKYVNTFLPADVSCTPGDVGPFLAHLAKLCPDEGDRARLLAYMAAVVQHPGIKFSWAPVIQGVPGNGKTLISLVVREAVGAKYTVMPTKKQLEKEFNSWMADKIFIMIEDVTVRRDLLEEFKPIITSKQANIELKGVDAEMRSVCCNFIFNCNPKDGVPKTSDDRRYAPFFTAQQSPEDLKRDGMDNSYFRRLYNWLDNGGYSHMTYFLRTYVIPDELNPATLCQRAPDTSSTREAISVGLGAVEQEIMEAVEEGREGFRGGFISSTFLHKLIDAKRATVPLQRRRALMHSLGYDYHPALKDGRTNNPVHPDNTKPRIYIHRSDERLRMLTTAAEVASAYTNAQLGGA